MNELKFTPKDWALFRSKIGAWQENYMKRLNEEYIALLSEDGAPSEKFWRLEKRIKGDRRRASVCIEMSRSKFIYNLISLINEGAIQFEDLQDFSDELKSTIGFIMSRE